jgi:hypothetical protein
MPNGSNSAAMRASGRIKRGQHNQSIEPSRPTKVPTYSRLTCSAANAQNGVTRTNLRAKEKIELTSAAGKVKM